MNYKIERINLVSSIYYVCVINNEHMYPIHYKNGEWLIIIYGRLTSPHCNQLHINYLVSNNIASIKQKYQNEDTVLILNPHIMLELI
jgi:hypothetical protein